MNFTHLLLDPHGPHNPHVKAVADLRGTGQEAVIVASSDGGALVWYESPQWDHHIIASEGGWSCDAAVADMDGDGDLDLIISHWYGEARLEWYENPLPDGDRAAAPWRRHHIGEIRAHDLEIGDIDGDGELEIATRDQGPKGDHIILWKRVAPDTWRHRVLPCPEGEGLALGDLYGDGRLELSIGGRWYHTSGDILADPWTEHVFANWPPDAVVKVADLTGDGRMDVVLTRSEGPHRLSWFENPAEGREGLWLEHVIDDDVDFAHSLVLADLTGDGLVDQVLAITASRQCCARRQ